MTAVHTRALGTLLVAFGLPALGVAGCDQAPAAITAPLMISPGVVVTHRLQDVQAAPEADSVAFTDARIIATGTLVMRGEPSRLFHAWKSLTLRPTVRVAHTSTVSGIPQTVGQWDATALVAPVRITDEIPCCFLSWRSNASAGCQWLDGEAWFHPCQHRMIDPVYTDVHLTLVCERASGERDTTQAERIARLDDRLRSQLLAFKTLVDG